MTSIALEPLDSAAFRAFGAVVPAGPAEEHLMDARIFAAVERAAGKLCAEPCLSTVSPEPVTLPHTVCTFRRNRSERAILVPHRSVPFVLVAAEITSHHRPCVRAFLVPPQLAVNVKAGVWIGAFAPLGRAAEAVAINMNTEHQDIESVTLFNPIMVEATLRPQTAAYSGARDRVMAGLAIIKNH